MTINNDNFIQVGELLHDLASQKQNRVIVVRSDDERLKNISISEIENIFGEIAEGSGAFSGYEKIETVNGTGRAIIKFSMLIDYECLRDYLIETYGDNSFDIAKVKKLQQEYADKQIVYWLSLTKDETVLLNDKYIVTKPQASSNCNYLMNFLLKNPNRECSKSEIEELNNIEIERSLAKTIDDLKFRGELKRLFFKSSKDRLLLRNPITQEILFKLRINQELLKKQIASLKIYC